MKKLYCLSFFIVSTLLNTLSVSANNEHIISDSQKSEITNDFEKNKLQKPLLLEEHNNDIKTPFVPITKTPLPEMNKEEHLNFRTHDENFLYKTPNNNIKHYGDDLHTNKDDNEDIDINVVHIPFIKPEDINSKNVECKAFASQDNLKTMLSCNYAGETAVNNVSVHCNSMPSFINNSTERTMNCSYEGGNLINQMTVFRNLPNLKITIAFKCVLKLKEQTDGDQYCQTHKTPTGEDVITDCDKQVNANQGEMQITCTLLDEYREEQKTQADFKEDRNSFDFSNIEEKNIKYIHENESLNNKKLNLEEQKKIFEDNFESQFSTFTKEVLSDSSEFNTLANKISLAFNTHLNSPENSGTKEIVSVKFNYMGNDENFKNILGSYNVTYKKNYDSVKNKSFKQGSMKGCLIKNDLYGSQSNAVNDNRQLDDMLISANDIRNECNEFLQKHIKDDGDVCLYTPHRELIDHHNNTLNTSGNGDRLNKDIPYINDTITPPNGNRNVINEDSENINDEHIEHLFPSHESQINAQPQLQQDDQAQFENQNNNQNINNPPQSTPRNIPFNDGGMAKLTVSKLLVNPKTKNRFFMLKTDSNNDKKSVVTLDEFYKECSDDTYTLNDETVIELIEKAGTVTYTKKKHWFSDETVDAESYSEIKVMATLSENIEKSVIENDLKSCKLNRYLFNEFKKMQLGSAFNMALSAVVVLITMCLFF